MAFAETENAGGEIVNIPADTVLTDGDELAGIDDTVELDDNDVIDYNDDTAGTDDAVDIAAIDEEELKFADQMIDGLTVSPAKLDMVRREHDYSRQTKLAIAMMVFIAVILATTQSYNPR
ncbi:MAG: hypothetical protein LBC70_00410 [Chitinispirillales bacterium]|nr:hypothetical protein [Chitinispirillales bacterium]